MYYKVLKNGKVIDVLDHLTFVKYQPKHNIMVGCLEREAQGIVSSDGEYIWHVEGFYRIPVSGYDTVELVQINVYEFKQLKMLNLKTPEEIVDAFVLYMIDNKII